MGLDNGPFTAGHLHRDDPPPERTGQASIRRDLKCHLRPAHNGPVPPIAVVNRGAHARALWECAYSIASCWSQFLSLQTTRVSSSNRNSSLLSKARVYSYCTDAASWWGFPIEMRSVAQVQPSLRFESADGAWWRNVIQVRSGSKKENNLQRSPISKLCALLAPGPQST